MRPRSRRRSCPCGDCIARRVAPFRKKPKSCTLARGGGMPQRLFLPAFLQCRRPCKRRLSTMTCAHMERTTTMNGPLRALSLLGSDAPSRLTLHGGKRARCIRLLPVVSRVAAGVKSARQTSARRPGCGLGRCSPTPHGALARFQLLFAVEPGRCRATDRRLKRLRSPSSWLLLPGASRLQRERVWRGRRRDWARCCRRLRGW